MWSALLEILAGIVTGSAGGLCSGLLGVGGGFVMIPLLALLLGFDQHRAQGATLAIMAMPIGLPGIFQYRKKNLSWNLRIVATVAGGFVCGVSIGSLIANQIPQIPLRIGFTTFLLCIAVYGWFRKEHVISDASLPEAKSNLLPAIAIGVIGGMTSGLTGLGGAVVMIPLLIFWFRMTQHQAQFTSLLILFLPIGLPGVIIYYKIQGGLPWWAIGGAVLGFDLGSYFGAKVATGLSGVKLKKFNSLVLLVLAGVMVWKIFNR
ncbi:MAG: sulfite exporter TauE/SafE family protein [Holophagaceae bacterium]|nr:sulfite exporter TauE/SafE family protein [Holophagaceae bacterium]